MLSTRLNPAVSREMMDEPDCDRPSLEKALDVLAFGGRRLGGTRALWDLLAALRPGDRHGDLSVLDVGAGRGDSTIEIVGRLAVLGWQPTAVLSDSHRLVLELGRRRLRSVNIGPVAAADFGFVQATASQLPFGDRSFDIVLTTTMLHHLTDDEVGSFFREASRVARLGWIAVDLRRSRFGYAIVRGLSATLWRSSSFSRNDAPVSVRRAFRVAELETILEEAGVEAQVRALGPVRLGVLWRRGPDDPPELAST